MRLTTCFGLLWLAFPSVLRAHLRASLSLQRDVACASWCSLARSLADSLAASLALSPASLFLRSLATDRKADRKLSRARGFGCRGRTSKSCTCIARWCASSRGLTGSAAGDMPRIHAHATFVGVRAGLPPHFARRSPFAATSWRSRSGKLVHAPATSHSAMMFSTAASKRWANSAGVSCHGLRRAWADFTRRART